MSGQITILAMINTAAALRENSLKDNIYLLDNLKTRGSENEGTPQLITAVNGFYWINGAQACDVVLNWLPVSIDGLPSTMSRAYSAFRSEKMAAATAATDDYDRLSSFSAQIVGIRGEAVDRGIIFPAQYESAAEGNEGWYWSATVNTNIQGIYSYLLDIHLFRKTDEETWESGLFVHEGSIKVTAEPKRNGFTGAGTGFIPLP
jgi:hypothetical protein